MEDLTMKTKKTVEISYVILLIMLIIALIYAAVTAIQPEFLVSRSFPLFTGLVWADFLNSNPDLAKYMLILERMAGGLGLAVSIGGLFVLITSYKKVVRWAWYYILVVGLIGWGNNLIANILFKNTLIIIIIVIGLALIITGLMIPVKEFFHNEKENT